MMEVIIKAAAIPLILALMIASSWYFLANDFEGALIISWVSGTLTATFGYLGSLVVKEIHKAVQELRGKS